MKNQVTLKNEQLNTSLKNEVIIQFIYSTYFILNKVIGNISENVLTDILQD
jgi:hypothetical protein